MLLFPENLVRFRALFPAAISQFMFYNIKIASFFVKLIRAISNTLS